MPLRFHTTLEAGGGGKRGHDVINASDSQPVDPGFEFCFDHWLHLSLVVQYNYTSATFAESQLASA